MDARDLGTSNKTTRLDFFTAQGSCDEPLRPSETRWLGVKSLDTCPGSLLLSRGVYSDHHDRFAQLAYALHHVGGAWGLPIPEGDEHVAGLRHLVITAHTGGLPEALPVSVEELMLDLMLPRPAVAKLIRASGAAGDDLRDAGALRCQRLAQELLIRERA
jgi:hypothetical protein